MEIKELRKHWEKGLEEKLFVVLQSFFLNPEIFILLSGDDGYQVHQYRKLQNEWYVKIRYFSNMKSALEHVSLKFKEDYSDKVIV